MKSFLGLVKKATDYAKSEVDLLKHGPVSKEVQDHRRVICTGITIEGKKISEPCEFFSPISEGDYSDGYCKGCGCPRWKRSKLSVKWTIPSLGCPKNKYPPVTEDKNDNKDKK